MALMTLLLTSVISGWPSVALQQWTAQPGVHRDGRAGRVSLFEYKSVKLFFLIGFNTPASVFFLFLIFVIIYFCFSAFLPHPLLWHPTLTQSSLRPPSARETNLKVKQSLTITGDLGDDVEKMADFNGNNLHLVMCSPTTCPRTPFLLVQLGWDEDMFRLTSEKYETIVIKRNKTQKRNEEPSN